MAKKIQVQDIVTGRRGILTDNDYNRQVTAWGRTVQELSKAQAAAFSRGKRRSVTYKSGAKKGKTEQKLRRSVGFKLKSNAGEIEGIVFTFARHGIFKEYGVSRGHGIHNHTRRSLSDWFSSSLQRNENRLADLVAQYHGDMYIRTFMGIKKVES